MILRALLSRIKWGFVKWYIGRKYHITFGQRVEAYDCIYEGYHLIGSGCSLRGSHLGLGTYVSRRCVIEDSYIGRYCSIANDVAIGPGGHPSSVWVTTYPAFYMNINHFVNFTFHAGPEKYHPFKKASGRYNCKIGHDVWIGPVGDGAIIGAGAVVLKDVAPYEIVAGVPARHIRYRFTDTQIKALLRIEWWNKDMEWLREHYADFENIDIFIESYADGTFSQR